jgi:hypothetical protein
VYTFFEEAFVENSRDTFHSPDPSSSSKEGGRPVALIVQLMQQTRNMHHVDEVLLWLADAMVKYLSIPVVQFWVSQKYDSGKDQAEPRASASLYRSLPQQVHLNEQIAELIERLLREQHGTIPLPVTSAFPSPQANWLSQYQLYYWAGYFMKSDLFVPPATGRPTQGKIATPLRLIVSLFTEHPPSQHLLRATNFVLDQSIRIMTERKLLSSVPPTITNLANLSYTAKPPQQAQLSLTDMIPCRAQNVEQLQANNPFASALVIHEKDARRLYSAIDGQKNIVELAQITHLGTQDMINALLYLVRLRQIRFQDPEGNPIESSLLFSLR